MQKTRCSIWCRLTLTLCLFQGSQVTQNVLAVTQRESSTSTCPYEWETFGNKCYKVAISAKDYTDANAECAAMDSQLLSIHSEAEQVFVNTLVSDVEYKVWTGLRRPSVSEAFRWEDNSPMDFANWNQGEPNNDRNTNENCVQLLYMYNQLGKWNDVPCHLRFPYICQKNSGGCGGNIYSESGVISSPNYPDKYGPKAECVWMITVPEGYQVRLKFKTFKVEESTRCNYDYVKILDGHDADSPVLGRFCGTRIPKATVSSTNKMSVVFTSDASYHYKGFSAQFEKDTPSDLELESMLRQLPNVIAGQKVDKLKQKRKKSPKRKSTLRTLEETLMKR